MIRRFEKLFSAIISDILDELGYVSKVLSPEIRSFRTGVKTVDNLAAFLFLPRQVRLCAFRLS